MKNGVVVPPDALVLRELDVELDEVCDWDELLMLIRKKTSGGRLSFNAGG